MIHNTLGNKINIIGTTEESRYNFDVPTSNLRFLTKFTNEFSGQILYAYPTITTVKSRFTNLEFDYSTTNSLLDGTINLVPVGYWKYEIYEVSHNVTSSTYDSTNSPKTEVDVLTVSDENGVVNGRVDIGKLHVHQEEGLEEVTYVKLDSVADNYIYPYGDAETPANTGDKHYKHIQTGAAIAWSIQHNLQKFPSVTVVDSAGTKVQGEVDYTDINSLVVRFTAEFGGVAYLN